MTDNLRERIAAALIDALRSQADLGGFLNEYEPCDDDGNPCGGTLLRIDAVVDQRILADAVIRELEDGYILVPKSHTVARWIPEGIFDERT